MGLTNNSPLLIVLTKCSEKLTVVRKIIGPSNGIIHNGIVVNIVVTTTSVVALACTRFG